MIFEEQENGFVFLIDKPYRWTSFDVVKKIRGITRIKKVGHAGTLDPLATGLLIICAGKSTKSIENYQAQTKQYSGSMELGKTTASLDLEKEISSSGPIEHLDQVTVERKAADFVGELDQIPPIFSAIKQGGKRSYDEARAGREVELKSRKVTVDSFSVNAAELPFVNFELTCSKGFYVRSLVRDFAESLGTIGYLKSLIRTAIGDYKLEQASSLETFAEKWNEYANS